MVKFPHRRLLSEPCSNKTPESSAPSKRSAWRVLIPIQRSEAEEASDLARLGVGAAARAVGLNVMRGRAGEGAHRCGSRILADQCGLPGGMKATTSTAGDVPLTSRRVWCFETEEETLKRPSCVRLSAYGIGPREGINVHCATSPRNSPNSVSSTRRTSRTPVSEQARERPLLLSACEKQRCRLWLRGGVI